MKLGNVKWACDRCGAEAERPAKHEYAPVGWQQMEMPKSYKRDLCPECINAFRRWFYDVALASALERTAR